MIGSTEPEMKLRALVAVSNDAARKTHLRINPNIQVPDASLLAGLFHDAEDRREAAGRESLLIWRHSDGTPF